jgi:adenosylcobinamide-GDP ribazoletransferase
MKESSPAEPPVSPLAAFVAAVQFLTVCPPILRREFSARELGEAVGFFPLVGVLIGTLLWAGDSLLALVFPSQVSAAVLLVLWVALTGLLHLDGFLDACDGLLGGWSPEQRLEIMHDERRGAFAVVGGILLLLAKFAALAAMPHRAVALWLAPTLGRWGIALAIVFYPYARPFGLGRLMKDQATWRQALLASSTTLGAIGLAAWRWPDGWQALAAMGVAWLALWLAARFALRRIPGLTGDLYGALNEIIEVTVLLFFSAAWRQG